MKSKSDPRHSARELALTGIFSWLFSNVDKAQSLQTAQSLIDISDVDMELAEKIVAGVQEHNDEIDKMIAEYAPDWPLDKIAKVDLVILRIAVFELVYGKTAPIKVIIDEAVELAKKFGAETSSKFINGVLGTVVEKHE